MKQKIHGDEEIIRTFIVESKTEFNAGALKRIGHEVLASSDCCETRVLLDCKIVTQVLCAKST